MFFLTTATGWYVTAGFDCLGSEMLDYLYAATR